jgi:diguanylate cyclase (GGDEF)-like protein
MEQLAHRWAAAIHGVCFVPKSRAERYELVRGFARRLATALRTEPFDPAAGYEVGAALVAADYVVPEVLARTVSVLHTGLAGPDDRVAALVEALVAGFTRALRRRTLDDQDEIRAAATVAQADAERALRESRDRFRYAALHDPLTDLPNEALLMASLRQLVADAPAGTRLGVCCLDLDRFGALNDSLGPPVGDRLLVAVADRLRGLAGEWGHLVARRSGDQFAILVEETSCAEDATKVADRTLTGLRAPFQVAGYEITISASAGVVEREVAGGSPTELMRAANVALHWAQADGRDRWRLYDERRSQQDVARYRLSAELPGALRRDEFTLAYQPLVDLAGGRTVGVEALARWRHPELGVLGADRFVSLAEDTGLILPLGIRLLEQACQQAVRWHGHRPGFFVSVNLSARQLHQPGLAAEVVEVLDRTGLPPELLQLEITESTAVATDRRTLATLAALAGHGIRIAIDDFGTGYSNFAYLYDLPVHGIKLAGELLREVGRPTAAGRTRYAVLTALLSIGHTLGLTVTAEGIETRAQARRLRALGCHVGQGWHFGRPAPAEQLMISPAAVAAPVPPGWPSPAA